MKKILALVLALAMILMVGAVYAEGEGETPATATALPKATISITNMEKGDAVTLYKIIKWDAEAADWAFDGITMAAPYETVEKLVAALKGNDSPVAMTALATAVAGKSTEDTATIGDEKKYEYEAEVGSYLALVKGANGFVYNPMVLSVNFTDPETASAGTIKADTAVEGTSSVAKKQPVTVDKEVDLTKSDDGNKNDIAVGDTIPFKVTTVTPNYGENYTHPLFTITDTLSDGIEFTEEQYAAIVVKNGDTTLTKGDEYTISNFNKSTYTITFSEDYLHEVKANTSVTVEYSATVNAKAEMHNVEQYDNDVDIVYSNSPTTNEGHDHDETHHYTFSIDASLLGGGSGEEVTKELVKIGYDEETDQVITSWKTKEGKTWTDTVKPLEGAVFELVGNGHTYTATSDENGYLNFEGLDAGTYTLTEKSAPAGYKFSTQGVPVVITAEYNDDMTLKSYTVTVNNAYSSTYTATLNGEHVVTETILNDEADTTGFINEKGVTLPSTGGIGTTIFYILGGLLVVGAAVILVARRKAQD